MRWMNVGLLGVVGLGMGVIGGCGDEDEEAPTGPERGQTRTAALPGDATMVFGWIEPGTFMMGSPDSEEGRQDDEGPPHEVTISQGFWLGQYEVTQAQWEAVMEIRPWEGQDRVEANPDHPAVYISWEDMQEFVGRLNQAEGMDIYRLPTEAEWEYACRAGTATPWSFGDDAGQLGEYAWHKDNAYDVGEEYGHPVGTKLPNSWGVHDMHGNVLEWCQNWYADSYEGLGQVDPMGPAAGAERVYRGGGFRNSASTMRSARRTHGLPDFVHAFVGARLLREEL